MTNNQIDAKGVAALTKEHPASAIMNCEQVDAMAELIAKQDEALRVMRDAIQQAHEVGYNMSVCPDNRWVMPPDKWRAIMDAKAKANSLIGGE